MPMLLFWWHFSLLHSLQLFKYWVMSSLFRFSVKLLVSQFLRFLSFLLMLLLALGYVAFVVVVVAFWLLCLFCWVQPACVGGNRCRLHLWNDCRCCSDWWAPPRPTKTNFTSNPPLFKCFVFNQISQPLGGCPDFETCCKSCPPSSLYSLWEPRVH